MMTQPPSFAPRPRHNDAPQPRHPRNLHLKLPTTTASVLVVTLASGLLFGMSAVNARHTSEASGELVDLVKHRDANVNTLVEETEKLGATINTLIEAHADKTGNLPNDIAYAQSPLTGPGITITLNDAPPGPLPENATPDDLVIHQQDIENVMNALWSGGAEAMSVQGKRVTNRSIIRCIGNVIYIDGVSYSPPYTISAIGDVDAMQQSVNSDRAIEIYQAYVAAYGLGWKLELDESLELAAAQTEPAVQHAHIMEKNG